MEQFEFKCPQCGQMVSADESLRGLVLYCPYCEKGIVVPKKAKLRLAPVQNGEPPIQSPANAADPNFIAIQRRLADHQQEEIAESERAAKLDKMRRAMETRALVGKCCFAVLAIGLCAAGFMWWKSRQNRIAAEFARQKAAAEEQERIEAAARLAEAKANAEKRKAEMEEARKKREAEREERLRRQEEEKKAREERIARDEAKRREQAERRKRFDGLLDSFMGMSAELWRNRPKELQLGKVNGVFLCFVPGDGGRDVFFEITSGADGNVEAKALSRDEEDRAVSREEYETLIQENGGLFAYNDKIYLVSPKNDTRNVFPIIGQEINPMELVFRNVYHAMVGSRINVGGLCCDVAYIGPGNEKEIPVGRVPFGQSLGRREIIDLVTQASLKSFKPPKPKVKGKKATVVWYDGSVVRRDISGVTYVPRHPSGKTPNDYHDLCAEADRQADQAEEIKDVAAQAERAARERIVRRIEKTFESGHLKIRIKTR